MKKRLSTTEFIIIIAFIGLLFVGVRMVADESNLGVGPRVFRTLQGGTGTSSAIVSGAQFLIGNPTNARYDALELIAGTNIAFSTSTDAQFSISATAGGGDAVTVNSSAIDTTANFLNGDIDWTLVDGGAGGPDDITGTVACTNCVLVS